MIYMYWVHWKKFPENNKPLRGLSKCNDRNTLRYRLSRYAKPFDLPIKRLNNTVYQIKIPLIKRFIKSFIRLKNSKRVFLSLHFPKPFLRVVDIPKPFYFRTHIRLSRGIWKSNTLILSSLKLRKNVHYADQLQKGLITGNFKWLIIFINHNRVDQKVFQMVH